MPIAQPTADPSRCRWAPVTTRTLEPDGILEALLYGPRSREQVSVYPASLMR